MGGCKKPALQQVSLKLSGCTHTGTGRMDASGTWGYLSAGDKWACALSLPTAGSSQVTIHTGTAVSGQSWTFAVGSSTVTLPNPNINSWASNTVLVATLTTPAGASTLTLTASGPENILDGFTVTPPGGTGAPVITTQPASLTVTAPTAANFSVVATGNTPLLYQWHLNGTDIPGATLATYKTPATNTTQTGSQFTVTVSNSLGSVNSTAAILTINASSAPPTIGTQPMSQVVTVGFPATFTVTANNATAYQWQKNGTTIAGATSATYSTPPTAKADNQAQFNVIVSNSSGQVLSSSAVLSVSAISGLADNGLTSINTYNTGISGVQYCGTSVTCTTTYTQSGIGLVNVTGLGGTTTSSSINLTWTAAVPGSFPIKGYTIFRSATQGTGYLALNSALNTTTSYIDQTVTHQTTYWYVVTATDSQSNQSQYSKELQVFFP
jgi:hypothetical protein